MTTTPTRDALDRASIDLIFALRDSLDPDTSPSARDFWGGRATTAVTTAADGSERAQQAITTACHKLQITRIVPTQIDPLTAAAAVIDTDYPAWVRHWREGSVYIVALAYAERDQHKRGHAPTLPSTDPEF